MTTLMTLMNLVRVSRHGISFQDKKIAFFTAGLGIIGHHRMGIRAWFREQIDRSGLEPLIKVSLGTHAQKNIHFLMRRDNEGDYLMGGEFIRGGYEMPTFTPKHIVDGGANIGMFSIQSANQFPNTQIACYEPDSENFRMLCKNIELNGFNIETHQLGLWSKEATLYYHSQSAETGFVDENPPGIPIHCTLPEIKEDCWLKLDVEGAEYEILPALFEAKSYPRWISMEVHYFDTKGDYIIDLLQKNGYSIKGGEDRTSPCTIISACYSTV